MKIGILTHSIANNFGANLQALSTATYLRNKGYEPIFLTWTQYLRTSNSKMDPIQLSIHRNFLSKNGFEITRSCISDNDFIDVINKHNIKNIIIGSDAVLTVSSWVDRLVISPKVIKLRQVEEDKIFPNPFWAPFANKLPHCKFFYLSPSCQSSTYKYLPKDIRKEMADCLSHFSYISARDSYTEKSLKKIVGKDSSVYLTPDPVWGFSHNITNIPSKQEILKKYNLVDDYFLVSFYKGFELTPSWLDEFRLIANKDNYEVYSLPMPQGHFPSNLPKIELPLDPIDWFALIKYSKGYVGNNMHPVIVSIHNSVPFFSIDQHGKYIWRFHLEKTSKVYDLLSRFSLLDYRISKNKRYDLNPFMVYSRIKSFDTGKLDKISAQMESQYLEMMSNITKLFIKE